jgi:hypothetical protein
MTGLDSIRKAGKLLLSASLVLGLCPATNALAETPRRPYYQCPPGYRQTAPAAPYYTAPGQPRQPGQPDQTPSELREDMQRQQRDEQQPDQQQQQPQDQAQQPSDFTPSPESSGRASLSPGMNTPQLGRLDQANRLNLFDDMAAAPQNKVWFGFQYSSGITTGLGGSDSFISFFSGLSSAEQAAFGSAVSGFTAEQRQTNYRVGAEVLITCDLSVAVQGQYFANETSGSQFGDDWSNPQIMIKQVLARDFDTVLSATLGITPETSVSPGEFNENTTKLYPGMLYYETLSPDLFTQGGFQFGIPLREDQITTFDWSVSLGYWLYRDCSLQCGRCCSGCGITGIIPQVNLLGKHTVGDDTRANAFGFSSDVSGFDPDGSIGPAPPFTGTLLVYTEPQDVLDLSIGTLIMIGCDVQVGVGYSFPITDDSTRESEFLSYVNYLF